MSVIDVFPFFNELDILELRLATLFSEVDYFVVGESVETFAGAEKPLYFAENESSFAEYASKIIYVPYTKRLNCHPYERDRQQKDALLHHVLANTKPTDLLILGDVDELPRPVHLQSALAAAETHRIAHFAQDLYCHYVNLLETTGKLLSISGDYPGVASKKWLGTRVMSQSVAARSSFTELRDPSSTQRGIRISNGGWHFSDCGSHDGADLRTRVLRKLETSAHQELNTPRNRRQFYRRIQSGRDAFGRRGARFKRVPLDSTFPEFLVRHQDRFRELILA